MKGVEFMFKIIKTKDVEESVDFIKSHIKYCEDEIDRIREFIDNDEVPVDDALRLIDRRKWYEASYYAYRDALYALEKCGLYKPN